MGNRHILPSPTCNSTALDIIAINSPINHTAERIKKNDTLALEAYTDADYTGSIMDRRSTIGYCTFLGGNLVTWRSKEQNVVERSSAESEFRAIAQGLCELLWLKIILDDLRIKWDDPMKLYCDNKLTINIAHNLIQHDRTKHIEVD